MNGNIFDAPTTRTMTSDDRAVEQLLDDEVRLDQLPSVVSQAAMSRPQSDLAMLIGAVEGRTRSHGDLKREAVRIGERMGIERALYSFPVKGGRVEGATVWLMEALAEAWGFLDIDVEREPGNPARPREVRLKVTVIDILRVKRTRRPYVFTMSPPPGKFAGKVDQVSRWNAMQFQAGMSKAIRTALEHALPRWLTDTAVEAARGMAQRDALKGKALPEAIDDAVAYFGKVYSVSEAQLEAHVGSARELWTVTDVVALRRLVEQLQAGERSVEALFGGADTSASSNDNPAGLVDLPPAPDAKATEPAPPAPQEQPNGNPTPADTSEADDGPSDATEAEADPLDELRAECMTLQGQLKPGKLGKLRTSLGLTARSHLSRMGVNRLTEYRDALKAALDEASS